LAGTASVGREASNIRGPAVNQSIEQDFGEIEHLTTYLAGFLEDEGKRLAGSILASASRLQVLHGRPGAGKTTVVRNHLLANLESAGVDVYYGDCEPSFPQNVAAPRHSAVDIREAVRNPRAIIIIDDFDRYLATRHTETAFASVFGKFDQVAARIVVVVSDNHLSSVFDFREIEPKCVESVFQIHEIDIGAGLGKLAEDDREAEFALAPDLVDDLRAELQAKSEGVSAELLAVVYRQLRAFHLESGKKLSLLTREHYAALGGLIGILRRYVRAVLERMEQTGDLKRGNIAGAILREIVGASASGRSVDFSEVCRRLDVSADTYQEVLGQLSGRGGLVREVVPGVYSVSPPQLMHGIREHLAELAKSLAGPRELIDEGTKHWEQLGLLLPEDRFREIHAQRQLLLLSDKAIDLMLRCSLLYDSSKTIEMVSYWHRRMNDPGRALDTFVEHLYHRFEDVRARAAAMLEGYAADARDQLHLIALQDPSEKVSNAAIATLARAPTEELRKLLQQEAGDARSPYRKRAVRALRIFTDAATVAVLRELVDDPQTEIGLRQEAIRSLAASGTQSGVDALVDIALADRDVEDRESAAAALGTLDEPALSEHMLQRLREPRAKRRVGFWGALQSVLRAIALFVIGGLVTIAALFLHGSAFAFVKRWRFVIAFFVIEVIALWVLIALPWTILSLFMLLALAVGLFLSLAVPAGMLLAELSRGSVAPRTLRHMLAGWLLGLLAIVSFFTVHGLAHALVRRWSRALGLFIMELLGIVTLGYLGAPLFPRLITPSDAAPLMSEAGKELYFAGGWALFVGSFLFDFGFVAYRWWLFPTRTRERARLDSILRTVIPNPVTADRLFAELRSGNRNLARWAGTVLARYGGMIAGEQLIDRLRKADGAELRSVVRSLAKTDGDATVTALTQLYPESPPPVRARIEKIFVRSASQRSLQALRRLWDGLSWSGKLRYYVGSVTLPFKLIPLPAVVILAMAAPLFIAFVYETAATIRHPERALFSTLDRGDIALQLVSANAAMAGSQVSADDFVATLDRRSRLAEAGAMAFPSEATRALTRALRRSSDINAPWYTSSADGGRVEAALARYRMRLVGALKEAAIAVTGPAAGEEARAAARALEEMHESASLSAALATEMELALLAILAHQGDEEGLARVLKVPNWENAQMWGAPLAGLQAREREAALAALQTLGTEHAVEVLTAVVIGQDNRSSSRGNARRAPEINTELKLRVVTTLGGLKEEQAQAALQRVVADLKRSGGSSSLLGAAQRQLESVGGYSNLRAQLANREYAKVIETGDRMLAESPAPDPVLLMLVGRAYQGAGDCTRSVESLEAARDRLSEDDHARDALVGCYNTQAQELLNSEPERAVELLDKAIELDDSSPFVRASHALALVRAGRTDEGLAEAADLINSASEYWEAYEALFEAAQATGTWVNAEQVLLAAVETEPSATLPMAFLAMVYHEGRVLESDEYFEKAHQLRKQLRDELGANATQNDDANYLETCLTTMRYEEASMLAQQLLEQSYLEPGLDVPMSLELYLALVLAGDRSDKALAALEKLAKVAARDDDIGWTFTGVAHFVQKNDLPDAPLSRLVRAVAENPDDLDDALAVNRALFPPR
jgi:tetratricopeptide (TPR) repeat protein